MSCAVSVEVILKKAVLDPQGDAILHALKALGFDNADSVRVGKMIHITFKDGIEAKALEEQAALMAEKLLCNRVMEDYRIQLGEVPGSIS